MRSPPAIRGVLDAIEPLDPVRDCQRIVLLSMRQDFPFDTTRSLEYALFRTFAVPGISALLDSTGQMTRHGQKRYDDTDIIVSELVEWGYDSERGKAALRRMNQIHGRFGRRIPNNQFLYVLSTFIFEPVRWNARFGWRPLVEKERLAYFHFWSRVGTGMGIQDIPTTYEAFEAFNIDYERRHYAYADANRRVGDATLKTMAGWFPAPLRPLVRLGMLALMDEPLLRSFGYAKPPAAVRWLAARAMRCRAAVLRRLPRHTAPRLRTAGFHRTYPDGYRLEILGPRAD
jgi:hypothetical protein